MIIEVKIPIYDNTVWFADYDSITLDVLRKMCKKTFKKEYKKEFADPFWEDVEKGDKEAFHFQGICAKNGRMILIVIKDLDVSVPDCINTISHEIFHAADRTLRDRGFELCDGSHEAWSYLTGYITEKIISPLIKDKYVNIKEPKNSNQEIRGSS